MAAERETAETRTDWDVVVIGAGAAGLLAATRAAELGARTLLLEKNRRAGVKILMSGGTRCNLTHNTDRRGIVEAFGRQGRFLHSALAALAPADLVALIEAEGVRTKVESTGKVFPVSNRAADVLDALLALLASSGAQLKTNAAVQALRQTVDGFAIDSSAGALRAKTVVVTSGGKSYPGSGATGDGYAWARQFGHRVTQLRPALTPITSQDHWLRELRGTTITDAELTVLEGAATLDQRRGSLLLTHFGISGPAALDLSRVISLHASPRALQLTCDFLPEWTEGKLDQLLQQQFASARRKSLLGLLSESRPAGGLPRRLVESLLRQTGGAPSQRAAETSRSLRRELVRRLKKAPISIDGTMGFRKAEVTAGGVSLDEVESRSLQSKRIPGLFWAGEVLDLDGPIGGFNFQAAFSTGWLAGEKAACHSAGSQS